MSPELSSPSPADNVAALRAEIERLRSALAVEQERSALAYDFIENGSIGLHWVGADGIIHWANQSELDLLGYAREEYIGKSIVDFHVDRPVIEDILGRLARNETLRDYEARLRCKNGDVKTVLINSSVLWQDGRFVHTRCFTRDITDYKSKLAALTESEQRYRTLIEQANDAIFVADSETGQILDANKRAEELLGRPLELIKGMHQTALHPPEKLEEYAAIFRAHVASGGGMVVKDILVRHASGRDIPVEISASAVTLNGKPALQGIFRDVSEAKRVEKDLTAKAAELARSNSELELFAATAAHDLQAPLRMIASYVTLLEGRYGPALDERAHSYFKQVSDAAERMQNLVKALLAYASVGKGQIRMEPVAMGAALDEAVENLSEKISGCHAAVTVDELPIVTGNRVLLVQLLQNLISNAFKFCEGREPRVRVEGKDTGSEWTFTVSDNGIGISPENKERIFGAFQRLHGPERFPGTGIGLATCKKIVEVHGGRMWVESTPGIGSMFFFSLPKQT